jgi:polar amino acid transport system substrate-binding protein
MLSFDRLRLVLALCALPQAVMAAPRLYLTTESSPPASMSHGGRVVGTGTDKVREIMARTGTSYSIELLPWKRAYAAALSRPDACVFSTTRTAERENLFKWVGPTDEADWVLLGRADRSLQINTLEDARTLRIGTYNGDARDEYLRTRGFLVDPAPNDLINPKKLLLNRIDLWAASLRRGSAVLEQNGWTGRIVPLLTFAKVRVYLACNPAVPDELIARMNESLEAMGRDGTLRRIERKYDSWIELKGAAP